MQTMLRDRHRQRWTPMALGPILFLLIFFFMEKAYMSINHFQSQASQLS